MEVEANDQIGGNGIQPFRILSSQNHNGLVQPGMTDEQILSTFVHHLPGIAVKIPVVDDVGFFEVDHIG